MYPPVAIGQVRVSNTHDITLGGRLHIPAGTAIWVPHHAIQNASFNWDDADKFKPGTLACNFLRSGVSTGASCSSSPTTVPSDQRICGRVIRLPDFVLKARMLLQGHCAWCCQFN